MPKFKYQCIRQFLSNDEIGDYVSYAIVLEHTKLCIGDISCDKEFVLHIVYLLNHYRVSPLHVRDIIDDVIASQ